jgi:hypothetical protein
MTIVEGRFEDRNGGAEFERDVNQDNRKRALRRPDKSKVGTEARFGSGNGGQ